MSEANMKGEIAVPIVVGLDVQKAREICHAAGLVLVSADVDGPPLGAKTWPGRWVVTKQHPQAGFYLNRWDQLYIEFDQEGDGGAGDREPREPLPTAGTLSDHQDDPLIP
jgi:hypothetical protein